MPIQTTTKQQTVVKSFDEMTDKQVDNAIAQSANTFKTGKHLIPRRLS
jgi:hypothetical protein